jgi:murein DD-endopeptidase MepM/ murein hydrolase activator NlpD
MTLYRRLRSLTRILPYFVGCLIIVGESLLQAPPVRADLFIRDRETEDSCAAPALSRLKRHRIAQGETLSQIAKQYDLIPATLLGINPNLRQSQLPVGEEIVIPPYNGIRVEVQPGTTLQDLANTYDVRADVIFEANGCQSNLQVVFIPGVNWSPGGATTPELGILSGYPLPQMAEVVLGYGWQLHPTVEEVIFHSGMDLLAETGTPVLSVGEGVVAFVGQRGSYGNVVVVNHPSGKQTRYAHLSEVMVQAGQKLQLGDVLGKVGQTGKPDMAQSHLHFEIRYNSPLGWVAENPNPYFANRQP